MDEASLKAWLADLSDQYEGYPYPHREPAKELERETTTAANPLPKIAHYLYGGRAEWSGFRALVAGGGTGDATVHLAKQLAAVAPDAEVVHIDLSEASMAVAKERIDVLGLENVRFAKFNLLDLTPEAFGLFDYVNCSGVLHHLPDPLAGLKALAAVLKEEAGGMSIMLYGAYGRIGIYHVQDMMRSLLREDDDLESALTLTRSLLNQLPTSNWLAKREGAAPNGRSSAAEIVDKYLHPHDKPFTVPEVFDLADEAGLAFVSFLQPFWYEPRFAFQSKGIPSRLASMSFRERAAFAERLHGAFHDKHMFYLINRPEPVAPPSADAADTTPVWLGPSIPADSGPTQLGGPIQTRLSRQDLRMISAIDGNHSLDQLETNLCDEGVYADQAAFWKAWQRLYPVLNGRGLLILRAG